MPSTVVMTASSYACEISGHFQIAYERMDHVIGMVTKQNEMFYLKIICAVRKNKGNIA